MADDNWEAFEWLVSLVAGRDAEPEADAVLGTITREWYETLSDEHQEAAADAVRSWQEVRQPVTDAEDAIEQSKRYAGGDEDKDPFGQKDPTRPEFSKHAQDHNDLLAALQEASGNTQQLIEVVEEHRLPQQIIEWLNAQIERVAEQTKFVEKDIPKRKKGAASILRNRPLRGAALSSPAWLGYKQLGAGGYGTADLWVKQDHEGIIIDRVVVKDSRFNKTNWNKPDAWVGSVPTEIQALYNLRPLIGSESIIKIRNWKIRHELRLHRTYTDFCPLGELFPVILDTSVYGSAQRFKDTKEVVVSLFIPEPFIWWLFRCMATVGLLMERGDLNPDALIPWELIVHRDLKLANIFLSNNDSDKFRGYPHPKVGDFGLAVMEPSKNGRLPKDILPVATHGNAPPEQHLNLFTKDEHHKPMTTKTNVYGMGLIIWSIIACEDGLSENFNPALNSKDQLPRTNWAVPALDASAQNHYSTELLTLVNSCLKYNDTNRPTFDNIMAKIQHYTVPGPNNKAANLQHAPADHDSYKKHELILPSDARDKWAIGLPIDTFKKTDQRPEQDPTAAYMDNLGGQPGGKMGGGPLPTQEGEADEDNTDEEDGLNEPEPEPPKRKPGRPKKRKAPADDDEEPPKKRQQPRRGKADDPQPRSPPPPSRTSTKTKAKGRKTGTKAKAPATSAREGNCAARTAGGGGGLCTRNAQGERHADGRYYCRQHFRMAG